LKLSLSDSIDACRLLADSSRLRLLSLLEVHPLSIAELTEITGLAQSRVSTHVSRLRRAGIVQPQGSNGGGTFYWVNPSAGAAAELWTLIRAQLTDARVKLDRERAEQVIRARQAEQTWAESVAGRMELHYSPGRTWEATARALIGLLTLGDTLDIGSGDGVLAELISGHAHSIVCMDISAKVLGAARERLRGTRHMHFCQADMHAVPFAAASFDHIFVMHALPYTRHPETVVRGAARLLRPGGHLIIATLAPHQHEATVQAFDHQNQGISAAELRRWLDAAGLHTEWCRITSVEPQPPYFEVVTALATCP
jgi:ArsR family transcriptional regulator